jgi:hypothetical protein
LVDTDVVEGHTDMLPPHWVPGILIEKFCNEGMIISNKILCRDVPEEMMQLKY